MLCFADKTRQMSEENRTLRNELQLLQKRGLGSGKNNKNRGSPRRLRVEIPQNLNLDKVYNPRYPVLQLMSTRRRPRPLTNPPRPPNSYFLLKNCYMLEVKALGYRYTMPELCIQSKRIWKECPQEVRDRYDRLQLQVQCIHNELYPGYKFRPRKRQTFKMHVFPSKMNENISSFSTTNYLKNSPTLENFSPSESESPPTISEKGSGSEMNSPVMSEVSSSSVEHADSTLLLPSDNLEVRDLYTQDLFYYNPQTTFYPYYQNTDFFGMPCNEEYSGWINPPNYTYDQSIEDDRNELHFNFF